jgi:cytochrome P450
VAREDVPVDGRVVGRGDRVFLMLNAANRDPRQFEEPDRLDLERADNRHVAFGHGIHFCLGASLARIEGEIALPALLARFPALTPRTEAPEWLDSLVFRGMRSLPVALG